jgi:hypothetical protein
MEEAVTKQQVDPNTVYHCLYSYYHLGYTRKALAHVFNKTDRTIGRWIQHFEKHDTFQRMPTQPRTTHTAAQRAWMLHFY